MKSMSIVNNIERSQTQNGKKINKREEKQKDFYRLSLNISQLKLFNNVARQKITRKISEYSLFSFQ